MTRKPGALQRIEEKMEGMEPGSVRWQTLESCRRFKTSWIEFGQALFAVHRDKAWREWGYLDFDAYCAKELGLKKPTALKLLKSYSFLETEEPKFLQTAAETGENRKYPDLESVNLLRLVKSRKSLAEGDYEKVKRDVFDDAKDASDVRKEVRFLIADSGKPPAEARADRRTAYLKRLMRTIEDATREGRAARFLPGPLLDELDHFKDKVERELKRS